jgi:GTP diphosphokinase / guanosine-3',5'-bis(diphosphate) 3'-diphosphatase
MTSSGRAPQAVRWSPGVPGAGYRVTVRAEALGRPHLLADLTEAIAAEGVGILAAAVEPPQEQRVRHTYTVELSEAAALPGLMRAMRRVPGVYDVYRTHYPIATALS